MNHEKKETTTIARNPSPPARTPHRSSGLYQSLRALLRPFWLDLKHRRAVRKYYHHADCRGFDWDWGAVHFNRIALVNLLLSEKDDPAYLEIGCASNNLFDSVHALNKVGVDPAAGGTIRETSDKFFDTNKRNFDVVFIDGLHTYEQVRRDVVNSLQCLNDGGWIAIHDMLPRNWIEHHTPDVTRSGDTWTGDVWKVAFELAQTEGLEFKILRMDFGIGVVKASKRRVALKDLSDELRDKEYAFFYENIGRLPIVEWEGAQRWLRT